MAPDFGIADTEVAPDWDIAEVAADFDTAEAAADFDTADIEEAGAIDFDNSAEGKALVFDKTARLDWADWAQYQKQAHTEALPVAAIAAWTPAPARLESGTGAETKVLQEVPELLEIY